MWYLQVLILVPRGSYFSMGFLFINAVWWQMSKLLFLEGDATSSYTPKSSGWCFQLESERWTPPGLLFWVRTCSQSLGIPAPGRQLNATVSWVMHSESFHCVFVGGWTADVQVCLTWCWVSLELLKYVTKQRIYLERGSVGQHARCVSNSALQFWSSTSMILTIWFTTKHSL